jgi:hypothetical protein
MNNRNGKRVPWHIIHPDTPQANHIMNCSGWEMSSSVSPLPQTGGSGWTIWDQFTIYPQDVTSCSYGYRSWTTVYWAWHYCVPLHSALSALQAGSLCVCRRLSGDVLAVSCSVSLCVLQKQINGNKLFFNCRKAKYTHYILPSIFATYKAWNLHTIIYSKEIYSKTISTLLQSTIFIIFVHTKNKFSPGLKELNEAVWFPTLMLSLSHARPRKKCRIYFLKCFSCLKK